MAAPYRIITPRMVIRCFNPTDAPLLKAAVDASREHLWPFMIWARTEPEELSAVVERLRGFRAKFDLDQDYTMGMFNLDETELLGGTGLHPRVEETGLEIGYWIAAAHERKGLVTEAAAALTRFAFEVSGCQRVEIAADVLNVRSLAVPQRLGYVHEAVLKARLEGGGDRSVYSMFADMFASSPCASAPLEAYGAGGERLI